jgi:hypothetical protein
MAKIEQTVRLIEFAAHAAFKMGEGGFGSSHTSYVSRASERTRSAVIDLWDKNLSAAQSTDVPVDRAVS